MDRVLASTVLSLFVLLAAAGAPLAAAAPAQNAPLRVARALILRAGQPESDINLKSYAQTFDALAIAWRLAPPEALEGEEDAVGLVLVVPGRTARALAPEHVDRALALVERGATLVTEDITPLAERLGFRAGPLVETSQLVEQAYPDVMIVWQRPGGVTALRPPAEATVLTREKWTQAPMAAVVPHGRGQALVLATELDPLGGEGYARFPYFPHALRRAGVTFPFRSERLAALFDYGYRTSVDLDYLARQWRRTGIQALHAGAWHFWEPDAERDDYLKRLITACHRNGILVYAWLELPHVSEQFWTEHPQWRERTAAGQDAHLDWRYLMNLKHPECFRAVIEGLRSLLRRFDWDGVNLSELYFESPQGPENPQRLTPFNQAVRDEFRARHRLDPLEFFREGSPYYWKTNPREWAKFVEYRVEQVRELNERFLKLLAEFRAAEKPHLGLAVTFVDNIYDTKMREAVGADIRAMLSLFPRYDFTLIMEDPGTVWHLGPRRYTDLARSYAALTRDTHRLGIDINVVERWQDVYPTKKQTGGEFLQLFHHAGKNFRTVLVYFEQSMLRQDQEVVAHALAAGVTGENTASGVTVRAAAPVVLRTGLEQAAFTVDGRPWPCASGGDVLLPAGTHQVQAAGAEAPGPRLVKLNGDLVDARYDGDRAIEFSYRSAARAIALFDRPPKAVLVDGSAATAAETLLLPAGAHRVRAEF